MKSIFAIFVITFARVPSYGNGWYDTSNFNGMNAVEDEFENPTTYSKRSSYGTGWTPFYDMSDMSNIMNTFNPVEDEFESPTTYSKRSALPFFMMP